MCYNNLDERRLKHKDVRKRRRLTMSGHSKWHNIKTPNLTATSLLVFKYPVLAQFWHNPINKEPYKTINKLKIM